MGADPTSPASRMLAACYFKVDYFGTQAPCVSDCGPRYPYKGNFTGGKSYCWVCPNCISGCGINIHVKNARS